MRMTDRTPAGLIVAVLAFAFGCGTALAQGSLSLPQATPAACVTAQTAGPVPVRVRAPNETLELRIADTVARREYGLMCVRSLPARTGMIFVFNDGDNYRDFWMKNTLIPLDMVWVSKNGRVNDVRANVPSTKVTTPDEKIPHRSGTGTYVIELAAGEAARAGIKPGTTLDVGDVPPSKE
jgi:uncharacterized membrane protein (UPF0127 family)